MQIDLKKAKMEFMKYVRDFDDKNEKIKLKINHTLKVMEVSNKVAKSLNLSREDGQLAMLIGLLHDIGRFRQLEKYDTFSDIKSVNHAELGVKILFEENLIRKFIEDDKYDEIIKIAILNHNKKCIDENIKDKQLLFCKIIRDADKIDIFRVLKNESKKLAYVCENEKDEIISEEVLKDFFEEEPIGHIEIKTNADKFVQYAAFIFNLYFDYSIRFIKKRKYIEKLKEKFNFKNEKTIKQVNEIIQKVNDYMKKDGKYDKENTNN